MSVRKHRISLLLLFVAAITVTLGGLAQGGYGDLQEVNVQFTAKDLPQRGLVAVTPSSSEFDTLVSTRFDKDSAVLEAIHPFSVLIKNTSTRTVVAYSLKWEMTRGDGKVATQISSYITLWKLMGLQGPDNDGNIIRSNSFALVTPSNVDFSQAEAVNASDPELLSSANSTRRKLLGYTSISLTIDGAFFDDGTYVGPDSTGLFSRVQVLRNGKQDLYREITEELKRGNPVELALKRVDDIASEPSMKSSASVTVDDLYRKYKRDAAIELLKIRSNSGDSKVIEFVSGLLKNKWPELKKLEVEYRTAVPSMSYPCLRDSSTGIILQPLATQ